MSFLTDLWEAFKSFILFMFEMLGNLLGHLLAQFISTLTFLFGDLIIFMLKGFKRFLIGFIDGFAYLFEPMDLSQYLDGFPPEALNIMAVVGFPQALSMIVVALGIRFTFQLIPFVRLGS